jgi:hypothetical protein
MLVSELERQHEDRDYCVQRLRIASLRRAGYGFRAALLLARERDLDFALAGRLSKLGCPDETAVRILVSWAQQEQGLMPVLHPGGHRAGRSR